MPPPDIITGRWVGEPRRTLLRDELARRTSPGLAAMYWQAIRAMDDPDNDERIPIAGYLLRELQTALPKSLPAAPQAKSRLKLGDFYSWLKGRWVSLVQSSSCAREDDGWTGSIDDPLATFLRDLGKWIDRYQADNPRWRTFQRQTLGTLDPALSEVPERAQAAAAELWLELHDFFNAVAHHTTIEPEEFAERLRAFEDFLGDRLIPRTFEKRDRIAELVREAEALAND